MLGYITSLRVALFIDAKAGIPAVSAGAQAQVRGGRWGPPLEHAIVRVPHRGPGGLTKVAHVEMCSEEGQQINQLVTELQPLVHCLGMAHQSMQ